MKDFSYSQEYCKKAFLVPFFGNLPPYFNYWAKSCEINHPSFHWFVYNDKVNSTQNINNAVTIIPYQFNEMISDFQKILNFKIPRHLRKVCEYRIMFYFIRKDKEDLNQFDFIGYTDIDMIYGLLDQFLPSDMKTYSMISADPGQPCGPFTLINRTCINALLESDTIKQHLELNEHNCFDESKELIGVVSREKPVLCQAEHLQPSRSKDFNHRKTFSIWDKGRVRIWDNKGNNKEGGFYHFSRYKDKTRFTIREDAIHDEKWGIYKYGIISIRSKWTILLFKISLLF